MIEIVDMYTNAFAYPAGGASGYKGGKFALVGPGWQGELPAGREAHRLADALDRAAAARVREGRGRPRGGAAR